jgi:hypothetical protein
VLPLLLCTPCLSAHTQVVLLSRREQSSNIVSNLIKQTFPIYRSDGSYTVGGELTFSDIQSALNSLKSELSTLKVQKSGMLSSSSVKQNFVDCITSDIDLLLSSDSESQFVSASLGILSNLQKLLQIGTREWSEIEPFYKSSAPQNAVLGIRKMFRVSTHMIGSGSDMPEVSKVYLFDAFIERTDVTIGTITRELNVPSSQCVVIGLSEDLMIERLRHINHDYRILSSRSDASTEVPVSVRIMKSSHTPSPSSPNGKRQYSSSPRFEDFQFAAIHKGRFVACTSLHELQKYIQDIVD